MESGIIIADIKKYVENNILSADVKIDGSTDLKNTAGPLRNCTGIIIPNRR
jgi:hypothetical protein